MNGLMGRIQPFLGKKKKNVKQVCNQIPHKTEINARFMRRWHYRPKIRPKTIKRQ